MNDGIFQLGNIYPDTEEIKNKASGMVYNIEGLTPTLNTAQGKGKTPIIAYGLSRSRDKKGKVVSRSLNPYVNCLHTQVGSARDNMEVYVVEVYEQAVDEDDCEGKNSE